MLFIGYRSFDMFSSLFSIMFLLFIGVFIFTIVRGISQWNKNNHSPVLTVDVVLVAKRQNTSYHSDADNNSMSHSSTSYYATFQVESGDRMELHVSGKEYGMMAEGDKGKLTFQGTRFHKFERQ